MKKILLIGQKEITENPLFQQDKNLVEMYEILSKDNNVDLLYLHKNRNENNDSKNIGTKYKNVKKYCIHDMMIKKTVRKNLLELITLNKYDKLIFMSYSLAQLVLPYIENILKDIIVVVDYRMSSLGYVLQKYKDESEKDYPNFQDLNREFRINFLQSMEIFQKCDYFIFDKDESDVSILIKEKVENIISVSEVSGISAKKKQRIIGSTVDEIEINNDNFSSDINNSESIIKISENYYKINESKYLNLIDIFNNTVQKSKSEYFFVHKTKLSILSEVKEYLTEYLMYNDRLAVVAPLNVYSRDTLDVQRYTFNMQRRGNFANWEKTKPMQLADCFMIKKSFLKRYGYFDNNFKTLDYALFDFLMRVYQKRDYYCTARDTVIFKYSNVTRPISVFKEDKQYLCHKWGENIFLF